MVYPQTPSWQLADINLYYDFADQIIRTRLERVPGVGASNVFGGRERRIEVLFDPAALVKRNITIAELAASIDRENENFSAGSFNEAKGSISFEPSESTEPRGI